MPQMPNMAIPNMGMPFGYGRAMSVAPVEESSKKRKRREKKPKDPDAPKRPATAYLMFCQEGRASVRKDLGEDAPYASVMGELRNRWNEMPAEEKKTWLEAYAKEFAGFKEREKEYKATKATNEGGVETPILVGNAVAAVPVPKPTSGFTAVNHAEKVVESEEEDEDEEEEEDEEVVEEPEEEQERQSSSSLSPPPPPPKPKATPKKRGPKAKTPIKPANAETPATEEKKKKPRAKKADKEAEAEVTTEPAAEAPAKKGRKKRKTQE